MKVQLFLLASGVFSMAACLPFLEKVVYTPSGPIRGTTTYMNGLPVPAFLGIPFAKPPVGDRRFQRPEPMEPWIETLNANKMPAACIQYTTFPFPWYDFKPGKSEDCLYLNIWAPVNARKGSRKAVLFWIFGGGPFGSNRKHLYDGRALAGLGDVIFVSPNFRLGLFGFLTSGTSELPGNIGMWDLLRALHWVRQNIESFGGDPDRITLHGESSGSFIVSMFCISPLTTGLFSKAIMQSGSSVLLQTNPMQSNTEMSQRLAKEVGCATDYKTIQNNSLEVVNCLKGKDAMYLERVLTSFDPSSDTEFLPEYGDVLFPTPPFEELRKGRFHKIPLLIGDSKDEGVNLVTSDYQVFGFFGQKDPKINKTYAQSLIKTSYSAFVDCPEDDVAQHYLGHLEDDDYFEIRQQAFKAYGDMTITCPTMYFAERYAQSGMDVYYYFFTHRATTTPWASWMGTVHFGEVQFVNGLPLLDPINYTPDEEKLSFQMVKVWSNFAKYGTPSLYFEWPKYSTKDHTMLVIGKTFEDVRLSTGPSMDSCNFLRACYKY